MHGYRCLHVSHLVLRNQKVPEAAKEGGRHRVPDSTKTGTLEYGDGPRLPRLRFLRVAAGVCKG